MKKSEIKLTGLQIKSLDKLVLLADILDNLEKEFGIREVKITLDDCFICPDININDLDEYIPIIKARLNKKQKKLL